MVLIDDSALLRKLEFDAGTTNGNILSENEWKRGKILASKIESTIMDSFHSSLMSSSEGIESIITKRQEALERLLRFRAALAPHKFIPPEILADIFVLTLDGEPVKFPPRFSVSPWIFRAVCSGWRQIALNEHRLWNNIQLTSMGRSLTSTISLINQIIPPTVPLSIISSSGNDVDCSRQIIDQLIIPNLPCTRNLDLQITISAFVRLFEVPDEHFSALESVCLDLWSSYDQNLVPIVELFSRATGFQNAHRLRELEIYSGRGTHRHLSNAIFNLSFPWANLTSIRVSEHHSLTLSDLRRILQKCSSLQHLYAELSYHHGVPEPIGPGHKDPLMLPHLRHVELHGRIQSEYTITAILDLPWSQLTMLIFDGVGIKLSEAYHLLRCCVRVECLRLDIQRISSPSEVSKDVFTLPRLKDLLLRTHETYIFACLMVPALDTLRLTAWPLPAGEVANMIIRSSCSLSTFVFLGAGCSDPQNMHNLLSLMPSAFDIQITNLVLEEDTMQNIASGEILPYVTDLECQLRSTCLMPFLHVLELRRKEEMVSESVDVARLRQAGDELIASAGETIDVKDGLRRIKKLNEEYGTNFRLRVESYQNLEGSDDEYDHR